MTATSDARWLSVPARQRPLYPGGPEVSTLAWGMWRMVGDDVAAARRLVEEALDRVAAAHGVSRSAAAYSWVMAHPVGAIPIIGTQQPARIAEALDAYRVRWTRADWYAVLVASRGVRLP